VKFTKNFVLTFHYFLLGPLGFSELEASIGRACNACSPRAGVSGVPVFCLRLKTRQFTVAYSWLVEQGLMSHSTQFRSFRRRCFYRTDDPTNNVKAL